MKYQVFWHVALCSLILTDVSEEFTASIIRATTWRYIPEDSHLHAYLDFHHTAPLLIHTSPHE
jgi:hypothetical protein